MEIFALGGYSEVGKNMTLVKVDNTIVILDMGLYLENYIKVTEEEDIISVSTERLIAENAIPDINRIPEEWKKQVKAIVISHAHLDHLGAVPYLANYFKCPILVSSYTYEVLKKILKDENVMLKNKIVKLNPKVLYKISNEVALEFINVTHSIPGATIVVLYTNEGKIVYANDFKIDMHPLIGKKLDFDKLEEIAKKGIKLLIIESIYANTEGKTPSEIIAREMLKDLLFSINSKRSLIIVTTFASHIARIKSLIEIGKRLGRKVVILGRSMHKYLTAAEKLELIKLKDVKVIGFANKIDRMLKKIRDKDRDKYFLIVTGHQGERNSVLRKMADGRFKFHFNYDDIVIFSCKVIPTPTNIANRKKLEKMLSSYGVRIFKDVHVSGHAFREDLAELIKLLKPEYIIPSHGDEEKTKYLIELCKNLGYKKNKDIFLLKDYELIRI